MIILIKDVEHNICLPNMEVERIDDEAVVYLIDDNKLAVLNPTARIVWDIIVAAANSNQDILSYEDILKNFTSVVDISKVELSIVENETEEVIKRFIDERIFIECED